MSYDEVLIKEKLLLQEPDFQVLQPEKLGIPNLIRALVRHQRSMIINFKPLLRKQLTNSKKDAEEGLKALPPCYKTALEKTEVFIRMHQILDKKLDDAVKNCKDSFDNQHG